MIGSISFELDRGRAWERSEGWGRRSASSEQPDRCNRRSASTLVLCRYGIRQERGDTQQAVAADRERRHERRVLQTAHAHLAPAWRRRQRAPSEAIRSSCACLHTRARVLPTSLPRRRVSEGRRLSSGSWADRISTPHDDNGERLRRSWLFACD